MSDPREALVDVIDAYVASGAKVDLGALADAILTEFDVTPRAFVPRVGMVIGKPDDDARRLVCVDDNDWLGYAPELSSAAHWFTDPRARTLIENHGWEVMGDLAAPKTDGAGNG